MVEQIAGTFGGIFERLQEIGELFHGKTHRILLLRVRLGFGVVHVMLTVGGADHPINRARTARGIQNGKRSREAASERERHEVAHGLVFLGHLFIRGDIGEIARIAGFRALRRGDLQTRLNFRDAGQVLFEALFVFAAEFALKRFDLAADGVEHAGSGFGNERPGRAGVEKPIKKGVRRFFRGVDVGFSADAAIVREVLKLRAFVGAAKTRDGGFERFVGRRGHGLKVLGRYLIDTRILHRGHDGIADIVDFEVRAAGTHGAHAGMMRMVRGFDGQTADDGDVFFERQKSGESVVGGDVPIGPDGLGSPRGQMDAIAEKPQTKTRGNFSSFGEFFTVIVEHEIEKRQSDGDRGASEDAAQEQTPRGLYALFLLHGVTSFVDAGLANRYPSFVTRAKTSFLKA